VAPEKGTHLFYLLECAATFYSNGGNHFGYGDQKFSPRLTKESVLEVVAPHPILSQELSNVIDIMYVTDPPLRSLGWRPGSTTAYYPPSDFTQREQLAVDLLLEDANIYANNIMIVKQEPRYQVKVSSVEIDTLGRPIGSLNEKPVIVTKGQHSDVLK
jgi:hypothetical protein